MSKNLRGLSERKGLSTGLYSELTSLGMEHSVNDTLFKELADRSLVGRSSVLGTSSFYDFLKKEHFEKKVFICDGTACLTSGKQEKLKLGLLEKFTEEEIGTVTCLGKCHSNTSFLYKNTACTLADLTEKSIGSGKKGDKNFYTGTNAENPALHGEIVDLGKYYSDILNYAGNFSSALTEIELSGLRGRGGAGFPFYIKLKTASETNSDQKYVVCNADEGDPGAFSDKWLLEERPHSVLFGMMITGLIIGADTGVIYIRGEYPESVTAIKSAIKEFEIMQQDDNLTKSGKHNFSFHVVTGAGAYICGEETSLLNSIEGLRPEVRTRPPFPAVYGLFGKPTVLSNVETFANLHSILKSGGLAYSAMGTKKSTGTKLVSLDGAFHKPGVYEIKMGTPLKVVLDEFGRGTRYEVKAFQIGGPLGGIVPCEKVSDLKVEFESFDEAGFLLGHAGVVSIPLDFPVIKLLLHLFEFTSRESCGKCFPCRLGSDRGAGLLRKAIYDGEKIRKELFTDLLETLQLGSLCALGGGLPLPVKNALMYFNSEIDGFFI